MGTGSITAGNMSVGSITGGSSSLTALSTGSITTGTIISSNINSTTNGTLTVGTIATGNILTMGTVSTNTILIPSTTSSSGSSNGALVIGGGAGIGGNLYVGGSIYMGGVLVGTGGGGTSGSGSANFGTNPLTAGNIIVGNTTVNTILSTNPYFNVNTSTLVPSNGLNISNSVTVYNALVLAGGSSLVRSGNNGTSWSGVTQSILSTVLGTAFGSIGTGSTLVGLWVAVGTGSNTIAYSYDGVTWTGAGSPLASATGVAYGAGMFIAYGNSATAAYSTNGSTWTTFTLYSSATYVIAVAYGNGVWGASCYSQPNSFLLYSTNGTTWTLFYLFSSTFATCIAFHNGFWVYPVRYPSYTQLNVTPFINNYTGTTQGSSPFLNNVYGTAYGGGILVLVGPTAGSGSIAYATFSGVSSMNFTLVSNSVALIGSTGISVTYSNGQFIALGSAGATAVSSNGTTWTAGGSTGLTTGNTVLSGYGTTVLGNTLYTVSLSSYQNNLLVSGSVNVGTNALSAGNISVYSEVVSYLSVGTMSVGSLTCTTQTTGSLVATVGITTGVVAAASISQNTTTGGISANGYITTGSPGYTYPEFVAGGSGTTNTLAYTTGNGAYGESMGTWTGNLNTIFTTKVNQIVNFTVTTQALNPTPVNPGANIFVAVGQGTNTLAYSYDGIKWTGLSTTIFSNDAISVASGYLYSAGVAAGPYVLAIGSNTNSTNSVAYSTDGVNWAGFGKTAPFGLGFMDSSCKIVYLYDTFIVFGGGTFSEIMYLSFSAPGWIVMGNVLNMTVTGLCYANSSYYAVGTGSATNTMASLSYTGGGVATGTYGTWSGAGKNAITGSAQGVVYLPSTAMIITIGTDSGTALVVNYSTPGTFGAGTTVNAASFNIGLTQFTGISTFVTTSGVTWVLIYGTSIGPTLFYANNISGSINSSTVWSATLGSSVFWNGSTATCNYALLGTATIFPAPLFSMTTAGNMTVNGNIFCSSALITQGLIYEVVNTCTQATNALSFSFATGGLWTVGTMISANATLAVTNIPTDTVKSYTFSVCYQQTSTRYYIATVQFQDTAGAYITNSGTSGFVAPLFNGGTPSLSGTTNCSIVQQFTVISIGGSRRVISTISCYS